MKQKFADIKLFLKKIKNLSLGYNEIVFFDFEDLDQMQIGYRIDPDGRSLVSGNTEGWQENWWVIAGDGIGDPIFVDVNFDNLAVLTAVHGQGSWDPVLIADSLEGFAAILAILHKTSRGRTDPVKLEKKPIPEIEKLEVLNAILKYNPDADIEYWEMYLT